jgi:hypothetical protein
MDGGNESGLSLEDETEEATSMNFARSLARLSGAGTLIALIAPITLFAAPAHAYFSTIDTGELVEADKYQAVLEPQLILSKYEGFNAIGRLDIGLNEASSIRGIIGFGKVDFQLGALYKWIPIPDVANQPAIGVEAGAIFARVAGGTEIDLRVHPLVSKRFETEIGDLTPYGSLPFGISTNSDETFVPLQIVAGAELRPLNMANTSIFAELGINLARSFSYISAAIAYRFDEESLRQK